MRFLSLRTSPLVRIVSLSVMPFSLAVAATAVIVQNAPLAAQESSRPAPSLRDVIILALNDDVATISEGSGSGVRIGSIFTLSDSGVARAKLRVTEVREGDSTARLFDIDRDFLVSVGDKAQYFTYEAPSGSVATVATPTPTPLDLPPAPNEVTFAPVPEASAPTVTSVPTVTAEQSPESSIPTPEPSVPATMPVDTSSTGSDSVSGATSTPVAMNASAGWTNVRVISIEGSKVKLGAGLNTGIKSGVNLPVWQNGSVVAILRVTSSSRNSSEAQLTWSDVTAGGLNVGDVVRIENNVVNPSGATPGAGTSAGVLVADGQDRADRPSAPMLFETGASNAVVPRTERTYEYLAALAASGLIQSQPADVFQDEGVRRHRTEEDLTFSRTQIAAFTLEAINNAENTVNGRDQLALSFLTREYSKELIALGVEAPRIAELTTRRGFGLGVSGQARLSLAKTRGGGNFNEPFSEPAGGLRTRSGIDVRTNLFGQVNNKLKFFATIDSGTKARPGGDSGFEVRRALLSYDASSLLKGLTIDIGRNEYWWGVGHYGTTVLSDVPGGLNGLHAKLERGSYSVEGLYAALGRGPAGGQRSLYARKVELKLGPQSRIGVVETLLQPKQGFDAVSALAVFSPVPLVVAQKLQGRNTDGDQSQTVFGVYGETAVARGTRLYGELLIDDISTTPENETRNRIGTLLGLHLFDPQDISKKGLFAEYTNLQGRTYFPIRYATDIDFDYNYFQDGVSLGYPVTARPESIVRGGAESLRFEAYYRPIKKLRLNLGLEFADRGSEEDTIARQQIVRFGATYDIARNYTISARVQDVKSAGLNGFKVVEPRQSVFQLQISRSY